MGSWGPALFSDDTACDVRGDFREMIEDGVDDAEAMRRVLEQYGENLDDPDEGPIVWLALAHTQSKLGRLDDEVRRRALQVIEDGKGLERWAEDPKLLARRHAALDKVRAQLLGPQPPRRRLRPPKGDETDLVAGTVLAYHSGNGRVALLRVARIDTDRYSVAPILRAIQFSGTTIPSAEPMAALADRPEVDQALRWQSPSPPWSSVRFRPTAHNKTDYAGAGFEVVGQLGERPGDDDMRAQSFMEWPTLAKVLERNLLLGPP